MIGMAWNAWRNTRGRVMKMSDGPESGLTPIEKAAGKRYEMRYINIYRNKPSYDERIYLVSEKSFPDMGGPWLYYYNQK